jgi:hypothetical protein
MNTRVICAALLGLLSFDCSGSTPAGPPKTCTVSPTSSTCDACEFTNCCDQFNTCQENSECASIGQCVQACSSQSCIADCESRFPGGTADFDVFSQCLVNFCSSCASPSPSPTPVCKPNCAGMTCGGDGCGGSCGTCPSGETCNSSGTCTQGPCVESGGNCTASAQCCQTGTTVPNGATCTTNDNSCHAICSSNSDCASGCCEPLEGVTYGACADATQCQPQCVAPGGTCTASAQCCQTGITVPNGATCTTNDNSCHAICSSNSDCASGCCEPLEGVTYGACADATQCAPSSCTTIAITYKVEACNTCVQQNCCAEDNSCASNPDCTELLTCIGNCAGAATCVSACDAAHPTGNQLLNTWDACVTENCDTPCGF